MAFTCWASYLFCSLCQRPSASDSSTLSKNVKAFSITWYSLSMRLGHIGLPIKDQQASKAFYDAVAPHIGLELVKEKEGFVGYGNNGRYEFYIHTNKPAVAGLHLCFEVDTKEAVDAFHAAALQAGGTDNGAPGIRADYSPTYYAAFVIDPNGNNIEALCRN
jgi:catechol 2,3-dioxygenase-like lactoylglutathione lyase family enzyme